MPTDSNHHSRNLTVYSFFFILYWLLGLEPTDDYIRLSFVNFTIHNTVALPYVTHGVLFYFAWRFYLNSKQKFTKAYIDYFNRFMTLSPNVYPYKSLKAIAEHDFESNIKSEYKARLSPYLKSSLNDFEIKFSISSFALSKIERSYQLTLSGQYSSDRNNFSQFPNLHENLHIGNYKLNIKKSSYAHLFIWRFIKFAFTIEDSPNFFIPWVLFLLAIITTVLRYFCIDFV